MAVALADLALADEYEKTRAFDEMIALMGIRVERTEQGGRKLIQGDKEITISEGGEVSFLRVRVRSEEEFKDEG